MVDGRDWDARIAKGPWLCVEMLVQMFEVQLSKTSEESSGSSVCL